MKLVIYRTRGLRGTGYRWTLIADNGRKLANGGQAYSRRIDMERAIEKATGGWFTVGGQLARIHPDPAVHVEYIPVEDRTR